MMSLLKPLGLLLLAGSCILGGAIRGFGFHRRCAALEEARGLLLSLRGQLAFTLAPPAELLCAALADPSLKRCDYLSEACRRISEGQDAASSWTQAVVQSSEPFTYEDRAQLFRVGEILGKSDLETQISQLSFLAQRLEQQAEQAREQAGTRARLSTTLGVLSGLALAVLFI